MAVEAILAKVRKHEDLHILQSDIPFTLDVDRKNDGFGSIFL